MVSFGTLTLAATGSYSFDLNNAAVQSLAAGQTISQSFDYTITDGQRDGPAYRQLDTHHYGDGRERCAGGER